MLTVTDRFEMAHRVPLGDFGESNVHGHSWTVELAITPIDLGELDSDIDSSNSNSVTFDIGKIQSALEAHIVVNFDHGLMVANQDELLDMYKVLDSAGHNVIFVEFVPTTYNIAQHIYNIMEGECLKEGLHCEYVKLSEGFRTTALYAEEA